MHRIIEQEHSTGKLHIIGNGHVRDLRWGIPEWTNSEEEYFVYKGQQYWLSEFMRTEYHAPEWLQEFDGYMSDTFFSGILVKNPTGEWQDGIKVYHYYS